MKFTLSWLKDHLETEASLEEIVETLTMIGLEVEDVDDRAAFKSFTIAKVLTAEKHPDADKLQVLSVDTGDGEPVQVVCGAPNARAGLVGAFAAPGTYVPGIDVTLSVGNIRGVESRGMMCSERELELSEDHDGIIDLPEDAPIGTAFADYAGLSDPVIEIGITPNRPDALGVAGIAKDLAAAGLGTVKTAPVPAINGVGECPVTVDLSSDGAAEFCPAFGLRLVRNVKNGPSPKWMQQRLKAIGLRPISALVDITNYVTFDRGRPLHVFDADKVAGNLVVRRANEGEEFLALLLDDAHGASADLDERAFGALTHAPVGIAQLFEQSIDLQPVFAVIAVDASDDRGEGLGLRGDQLADLGAQVVDHERRLARGAVRGIAFRNEGANRRRGYGLWRCPRSFLPDSVRQQCGRSPD